MWTSNNPLLLLFLLVSSSCLTDAFSLEGSTSKATKSSSYPTAVRTMSRSTALQIRRIGAASAEGCHPKDEYSNNDGIGRRSLLLRGLLSPFCLAAATTVTSTVTNPNPAHAAPAQQVRGPIELLRPATRVKLYIDEAISICQQIKETSSSSSPPSVDTTTLFQPITEYLLEQEPISYMTSDEERLSKRYLEIDTSSAWQAKRLKEREVRGAEMGVDYTTPYDRFNTAVQQWGDKQTFQILRQRQRGMEQNNGIRAAFNAYTNNLVFGDSYQLNVQGDAKKSLVRNDALPDVNAVVVSDLDLRDLYRNQVLQNFDDAKAEVVFQQKSREYDIDEVLIYLKEAQTSCKEWFSFIPQSDVEEALQAVRAEQPQRQS